MGSELLYSSQDFSTTLGSIFSEDVDVYSPKIIQEYLDKRSFDHFVPFSDYTKYVLGKSLPNTLITRSIVFRSYIDDKIYNFASQLYEAYSYDKHSVNYDDRFVMRSMVEKLIQLVYQTSIGNQSHFLAIPGDSFMDGLLKISSIKHIKHFVGLHHLDIQKMKIELGNKDAYPNAIGDRDFMIDGFKFVPYTIAKHELETSGNVILESSLLRTTEDGSSMFKYRTGLEIKRSTLDNAKHFFSEFTDYLRHIGKRANVTIRGGREWGHEYDSYFDVGTGKPIRSRIENAKKASGGRITKHEILHDSHIFGNCLDLRVSGVDGLLLYIFINAHCHNKLGKKSPIIMNTRMRFIKNNLSFDFLYHGGEPMGGHFHCYFS